MVLFMEIWKDIPEYKGLYEASNYGRIRTKEGKTTSSARFKKRVWKQRILKPKISVNRYGRRDERVSLWKDGKAHDHLVARLIATTFCGDNIQTKLTVNHIDGNSMNNHSDNLEWLSLPDNIKYGFEHNQYKFGKSITLIDSKGSEKSFKSYSKADSFLNRYRGYTSRCILLGVTVLFDINGAKYFMKFND